MTTEQTTLWNPAHLDHLSETVEQEGRRYRLVHIYAAPPDYQRIADPHEGAACIDDVARTAVLFLRHFELTGDVMSHERAEELLEFVLFMQADDGLFFNFVVNNRMEINVEHHRSRADRVEWWMGRAIWALGVGAETLAEANPKLAGRCVAAIERSLKPLEGLLATYAKTRACGGRLVPTWLIAGDAADATSELLLGLVAFQRIKPSAALDQLIDRLIEGIALMRYGSMNVFPYGLYASWRDGWHMYGNAQTQALAEAGRLELARREADHFYPRLLTEGFRCEMSLDHPDRGRLFEQIAYGVRPMAVGLVRLWSATGDERYGVMAGLAASWLTGNNAAGVAMYDSQTGRGYDGLDGAADVNVSSGAESTIEALYTVLEIETCPPARDWLYARGDQPVQFERDGESYLCRVFKRSTDDARVGLLMNLTQETFELRYDDAIDEFGIGS